jgi:hypothetical protein
MFFFCICILARKLRQISVHFQVIFYRAANFVWKARQKRADRRSWRGLSLNGPVQSYGQARFSCWRAQGETWATGPLIYLPTNHSSRDACTSPASVSSRIKSTAAEAAEVEVAAAGVVGEGVSAAVEVS